MENKQIGRRLTKRDGIFFGCLVVMAILFALWFWFGGREAGTRAVITVDGTQYGTYELSQDQEIPIKIQGETSNTVRIRDGDVSMEQAGCPDQICVRHKEIRAVGESIICLPNRVTVTVTGEDRRPELDTMAN